MTVRIGQKVNLEIYERRCPSRASAWLQVKVDAWNEVWDRVLEPLQERIRPMFVRRSQSAEGIGWDI